VGEAPAVTYLPAGTADFDWGLTKEAMKRLIDDTAKAVLRRYPDGVVTDEAVGFLYGFLAGRNYHGIDISDAVLASMTARD
jgi:hypothetical protein